MDINNAGQCTVIYPKIINKTLTTKSFFALLSSLSFLSIFRHNKISTYQPTRWEEAKENLGVLHTTEKLQNWKENRNF